MVDVRVFGDMKRHAMAMTTIEEEEGRKKETFSCFPLQYSTTASTGLEGLSNRRVDSATNTVSLKLNMSVMSGHVTLAPLRPMGMWMNTLYDLRSGLLIL
jgi:hypothetical protein